MPSWARPRRRQGLCCSRALLYKPLDHRLLTGRQLQLSPSSCPSHVTPTRPTGTLKKACTAELCSRTLQEAGEPDINIITEKVAFDSVTRFEDQQRLPLGISINAVAYGARMLTQAAFEPRVRPLAAAES